MNSIRKISIAAALVATLGACAQTPSSPTAGGMPGMASPPAAMAERMSKMDAHMNAMREMHDRMARARTPEERNALMPEHMKLMQEGMAMMGGMGPGGMRGMGGMGGMGSMSGDMAGHQQMMEKRMEMMQSMMQMMMDRMPATPAR
jgi:hypothetical protein